MFIPTGIVTTWRRTPWANVALIALCGLAFCLSDFGRSQSARESFALWSRDTSLVTFVTHNFMHANGVHLIGNMIFLWAFGNAAAGRLHPALYVAFFVIAGIASAAGEMYLAGGMDAHVTAIRLQPRGIPMVGASGSIMGVAGLCAVLFPVHHVRGVLVIFVFFKRIQVRTLLLVLFFAALDLLYLRLYGHNGVAYVSHLSGFAIGVAAGFALLLAGWVDRDEDDLISVLRRKFNRAPAEPPPLPRQASRLIADPDLSPVSGRCSA